MSNVKAIVVKPISSKDAKKIISSIHYSKKTVKNSQIHLGVFLNGKCGGAMQFGPPIDKRNLIGLVKGTGWNEFIELNRMALSDWMPRNSESRSLGIAFKIIKKNYPQIRWCVSFSDATQCGDGIIYRASGFVLTGIKKNETICRLKSGEVAARHGTSKKDFSGSSVLDGFQLRYVRFINKSDKENLTVPEIDFSEIDTLSAKMYKGKKSASKV